MKGSKLQEIKAWLRISPIGRMLWAWKHWNDADRKEGADRLRWAWKHRNDDFQARPEAIVFNLTEAQARLAERIMCDDDKRIIIGAEEFYRTYPRKSLGLSGPTDLLNEGAALCYAAMKKLYPPEVNERGGECFDMNPFLEMIGRQAESARYSREP